MKNTECISCGFNCKTNYLATHTKNKHNLSLAEYYDKFLKKDGDGICSECENKTTFRSLNHGYSKTCSKKCAMLYRNKELFKKYGVINNFQLEHIKEKSKKTMMKKYGVENTSQLEDTKKKKINTCLKNHGVENPGQSESIKDLIRKTNIEKYGAENPMFNSEIAQRAAINGGGRAKAKYYQTKFGNLILVQGSYEMLFVQFCEKNDISIEDGPSLCYDFDGGSHRYFIDFKINVKGKTKLVEIKSTYWYNEYREQNEAKISAATKYAEDNGFRYHFIINDNNKKKINIKRFDVVLED
jgi:hypothetical protein